MILYYKSASAKLKVDKRMNLAQVDALTARTFSNNPPLHAALARLQAQRVAQAQAETFRNEILFQRAARIERAYRRDLLQTLASLFVKPQREIQSRLGWVGGWDSSEFRSAAEFSLAIQLANRIRAWDINTGAQTDGSDAAPEPPAPNLDVP